HADGQLRTRSAVLVAHGSNARSVPGLQGQLTPEPAEGRGAGKQPCCARTRVDDVAHVAGVVAPDPLELINLFVKHPSDHVAPRCIQRLDGRRRGSVTCPAANRPVCILSIALLGNAARRDRYFKKTPRAKCLITSGRGSGQGSAWSSCRSRPG